MTGQSKRLLLFSSKLGYQVRGFAQAAQRLGAQVIISSDRCHQLDDPWQDSALPLRFEAPEQAAALVITHVRGPSTGLPSASLGTGRASGGQVRGKPVDGLLALGDRPILTAAHVARALGLAYNSPAAVANCRSKIRQREVLRAASLPVPGFFSFALEEDLAGVLPRLRFPCVVKPYLLAASQGVIRADNEAEFVAAVRRNQALLSSPEIQVTREPELDRLLVEDYLPGSEVALEGLLDHGRLRVLALFDKPDPLEGPFFEETIYVTPSRLPQKTQERIRACAEASICALGLVHGPLHAEFRVRDGAPWVLEVQPRPIGGLCSRALRFGPDRIFLEELLVRHALELEGSEWLREEAASGVMMIPVPQSGIFERVEGVEDAKATPAVEEVEITARPHDYVAAWPEGSSYLGFIFARSAQPEEVEGALRQAHGKLRFVFAPRLPVEHPLAGRVPAGGGGT
jgi:formate-dependent phosphoribosylglycinamide formyltransferase (GAR transformylase)